MVKRTVNRIILGWVVLLILVALLGKVSVAAPNGGRTAAEFLHIGLGARAAGMGGAYSAVDQGAGAAYWNPAGLKSVEAGEAVFGHFAWYQDITMEQGIFAWSLGERSTVAASMSYMNYGSIEGRDLAGAVTSDLKAYDWYGALSWGYAVSRELSFGMTGKFIAQQLDDIAASTFAADFGVMYHYDRFTFAATAVNIGPDMDYAGYTERLPSAARLGVSAAPFGQDLLASLDVEKRFYGETVIRQGLEYGYHDQYFLRTGYNFYPSQEERSMGAGWSFGAGLRMDRLEFDYAYTLKESYASDDLHRFSLGIKFGQ